jgi:hypothetical protein
VDESSVSFRIWVRRSARAAAPFSVRFEVFDGKGILRVARPGILIDPPARVSGFEEQLSSEQLKASRFLHVWGAGRKRQSHILSRLEDARLDRLAPDNWYELTVVTDGGYRYLELENLLSATSEEPAELVTKPLPREEIRLPPPRRADPPPAEPIAQAPARATDPSHPFDGLGASTVLVRLLRRKLQDVELQNSILTARVSALEAELGQRR